MQPKNVLFQQHLVDRAAGATRHSNKTNDSRAMQVRCMVAVLLLVGQGLESPDVVATMLDLQQTPAKPQYLLASEVAPCHL